MIGLHNEYQKKIAEKQGEMRTGRFVMKEVKIRAKIPSHIRAAYNAFPSNF
jgi:hypothetical protein